MSERILAIVGTVLWLVIVIGSLVSVSGCNGLLESIINTFTGQEEETEVVPPTPAKQLYELAKRNSWISMMAIPIIALGAVAMFNGFGKLGMSAVIFGSVNLFMTLATARFALWMAVFGLIGSVTAVAASILAKNKALRDIICNLQTIKQIAKDDNVDLVFQDKIKETLKDQVKSTKKIVANVKTKVYGWGGSGTNGGK